MEALFETVQAVVAFILRSFVAGFGGSANTSRTNCGISAITRNMGIAQSNTRSNTDARS